MRRRTIAVWPLLLAPLFACMTAGRVEQRRSDLVPREPANGKPEAWMRISPDAAAFGGRLAEELAQAGILIHLADSPPRSFERTYVVAIGAAANAEVPEAAGRVAIAPTEAKIDEKLQQPLLLIRAQGPAAVKGTARPVWELRFDGLKDGVHLSVEEEHTVIEAVVLWVRNRAVD